jgi:peroxiredoxin
MSGMIARARFEGAGQKEMKMSPNKRRPALTFALALMLVALSWVAPVSSAQGPRAIKRKTTDGGEITSEMVRGDVVVLAFGSSQLGPLSRRQVENVQELADEFGARDVRVYWVTTDSDKPQARTYATDEQLRAFANKAGLKAAVLRDPDGALFKKTGADQLPAIVILDRSGTVSVPVLGGHDPKRTLVQALSDRLNRMLAAK